MIRTHGDAAAGPGLADFAVNVNPLGPPPALGAPKLSTLRRYPDSRPALAAVSRRLNVPSRRIALTAGAADAVYLILRSLKPRRVHVLVPTFTEYEDAARAMRIPIRAHSPVEPFRWDLRRADPRPGELLFICNPNNPTGSAFLDLHRMNGARLVVDESFIEFSSGIPSAIGHAWVIRSLTKIHSLPGLRAGFIVAPKGESAERLILHQPPWPLSAIACGAIPALMSCREHVRRTRRHVRHEREVLSKSLGRLPGLTLFPSRANFLLLRVPDARRLCKALRDRGIVVRNCDSFTGLERNRFIRIAVRSGSENRRLVRAIEEVLA